MPSDTEVLGDDQLLSIQKDGCVPHCRISSARALIDIHENFEFEDRDAAWFRSNGQAMVDGDRPYDEAKLRERGLAGIVSNFNPGEAAALLDAAKAPYIELLDSVPRLADVTLDLDDESLSYEASQIVSENFDWMQKEWPELHPRHNLLTSYYVGDGVGIAYFPDDRTWQWDAAPIGSFLLDRDTPAYDQAIEVATCKKRLKVSQLYSFIRDEEAAAKAGWNVEAVKKAIFKAHKNPNAYPSTSDFWEEFVRAAKENDIYLGYNQYNSVEVIYAYTKEFDGTISAYMANREVPECFLWQRPHFFNDINECFVLFTYGVGSGTYHSIRGLKYKMFYTQQHMMRSLCRMLDAAELSATPMIQADGEVAQDFKFAQVGPFSVVPPGFAPFQVQIPNAGTNLLPVYQMLAQITANNTGSYQGRPNPLAAGRDVTAEEVRRINYTESILGSAAMNLFYPNYTKLMNQVYRRAVSSRITARDKGGALAYDFRRRCHKAGISIEMMRKIKSVRAVRAIGNGSPQLRAQQQREIIQLQGAFDEVGKRNALRDTVAAISGSYEFANRYVPQGAPRTTTDYDVASLENANLESGKIPQVFGHQNHFVHAETHFQLIINLLQALKDQQVSVEQVAPILRPAIDHTTEHVLIMAENPIRAQEAAQARRTLQMVDGEFASYERALINQLESQQQEAQQQTDMNDPKQVFELQKMQIALETERQKQRTAREKSEQQLALIAQKMKLNDMTTANNIAQQRVQAEVQARGQIGTINAPTSTIEALNQ